MKCARCRLSILASQRHDAHFEHDDEGRLAAAYHHGCKFDTAPQRRQRALLAARQAQLAADREADAERRRTDDWRDEAELEL